MPSLRRFGVGFGGTLSLATGAIVYFQVFQPILNIDGGGPFAWILGWIDRVVPVVILGLLLVLWLWVLSGGVQEERARQRRPL